MVYSFFGKVVLNRWCNFRITLQRKSTSFFCLNPNGQLFAEFFGHFFLKTDCGLVVQLLISFHETEGFPQFILRQPLHAYQKSTTLSVFARPVVDIGVKLFPPAQVEIAHAEIGTVGNLKGFPKGREQLLVDIVENSRHGVAKNTEFA